MPGRSAAVRDRRHLGHRAPRGGIHAPRTSRTRRSPCRREAGTQEAHHVAHALVRLLERDAVPTLDDDVRRRPQSEREPSARPTAHRRHGLGQVARPPGERRHDGGPEPQLRGPRRPARAAWDVRRSLPRPTTRRCSRAQRSPRTNCGDLPTTMPVNGTVMPYRAGTLMGTPPKTDQSLPVLDSAAGPPGWPSSARSWTGWRWRAACRPQPRGARRRDRSRPPRLDPHVGEDPLGGVRSEGNHP